MLLTKKDVTHFKGNAFSVSLHWDCSMKKLNSDLLDVPHGSLVAAGSR